MKEIDITNKIMTIERLKANLFVDLAHINLNISTDEDENLFSDICEIILNTYLLGEKLGFSHEEIEKGISDKIRVKILEENNLLNDYIKISKFFKKNSN